MANYPQELAQDAVCQSHTGYRTGLWFQPTRPLRLNTNEWMNEWMNECFKLCRSQWPRFLRRRSETARLLRLWVRTSLWTWISVCCECCVLSGRGPCGKLITCPEESYRLWCVVVVWVWNLVNKEAMAHWGGGGLLRQNQNKQIS